MVENFAQRRDPERIADAAQASDGLAPQLLAVVLLASDHAGQDLDRLTAEAIGVPARVTSLTIQGTGTLEELLGTTAVRVYLDVDEDGVVGGDDVELGSGTYDADDGAAHVTLVNADLLPGNPRKWLVTYDLAIAATLGATFEARIEAASDATAELLLAPGIIPVAGASRLRVRSFPSQPGPTTIWTAPWMVGKTARTSRTLGRVTSNSDGVGDQ